jgi:hypothetical protein
MHTSNAEVRNTTYVYNEGKINCRRDIFLFPTKENLKEKRSEKIFETPFRRLIVYRLMKLFPHRCVIISHFWETENVFMTQMHFVVLESDPIGSCFLPLEVRY